MLSLKLKPVKKITAAQIEQRCIDLGLTLTMRASLKTLDDNTHWHFKKGKEKGTLEMTLLHKTGEVILECKKNRMGDWVEGVMERVNKEW